MMTIHIDVVTAMQFLKVQNRHQGQDWTMIGSGANDCVWLVGTLGLYFNSVIHLKNI